MLKNAFFYFKIKNVKTFFYICVYSIDLLLGVYLKLILHGLTVTLILT